ncbi:glycine betaine ABC transporter substrate-binding protein [Paracoccus sp. APAP_BH8]|uniref:glycine betaine ABC transporter substrate-binding protein n=1 Tax=Paracoccus TaxID=265 RepID=UPI0004B099CE|nr:glycine betaine ABC transporter substrate-binding protein [Paracoccus pantotrophus]MDF3855000.1 glycine betaine ABC transporter substrate-binding protein [Paracoccus pantotrophus]SFO57884.1 glycine betaine/proline transport system substrate-binding protein [Paracoccus pantotrophus]
MKIKAFCKALAVAAVAGLSALPALAQDKTIKLGTMAWEDLVPITGIAKKVLEDKGYTVEVTEFSEIGIAYAALTKGDVQAMVSQTDYIAQDYWNKNKSRLEKISTVSSGCYQTFAVPSYVQIESIEELNANSDLLGGKIIGIEPGSGLMRDAADAMKEYGIELELVEGSTAGMTAALKSAVDRQQPIAVTLWNPSWMFQKFDMKFLQDPKAVFAPPCAYHMIAHKDFSAEHPEARELLAAIYVPLEANMEINTAVVDGKTMDQAVQDWLEAHAELVGRWGNIKSY